MTFWRAILPLMEKELLHVRRDARTLAVLFLVPTALMLLIGMVVNFNVDQIKMGVLDQDHTEASGEFTRSFSTSGYFTFTHDARSAREADDLLDNGQVAMVLVVPQSFSQRLARGEQASVQVLVDGSDASTAPTIVAYANAAIGEYSANLRTEAMTRMGREAYIPADLRPRVWYNPALSTVNFMIPGLIGYVLMMTCVMATAMSVVREKERGTLEQLVVSAVSPAALITGKLLPYLFIALSATVILLVSSVFIFSVAIKGSLIYLFISVLLFLVCALALGLWVSTVSRTQLLAFTLSVLVSTLPSMMLSGFIYPIRSMPFAVQVATNLTPVKFFVRAIRAIMLKAVGPEVFWTDWAAMLAFASIVTAISAKSLRNQSRSL